MWTIQRMDEMDDGDEERLPGEPIMTAVTLEGDLGEILQFQMPHNWLLMQGLQEGEEWPDRGGGFRSVKSAGTGSVDGKLLSCVAGT